MAREGDSVYNNVVRVGEISSYDAGKRQARVTFPDKEDIVSGELKVLDTWHELPNEPKVGDRVVCLFLANGDDGFVLGKIV